MTNQSTHRSSDRSSGKQGFSQLTSIAAPLYEDNIDTDVLYPGRFLTRLSKKGMSECLLYDRRFDGTGHEKSDFVLNQPAFRQAEILIAGMNFGCGSSRETAVWALRDYGFRCVIARSFGEIFYANSFNNMLLPIVLSEKQIERIIVLAQQGIAITVDLERQSIVMPDSGNIEFEIADNHRQTLLTGLDEISLQLKNDADDIAAFEDKQKQSQPWLW